MSLRPVSSGKGFGRISERVPSSSPDGDKNLPIRKKKRSFRGERYVEQYLVVQVSLL